MGSIFDAAARYSWTDALQSGECCRSDMLKFADARFRCISDANTSHPSENTHAWPVGQSWQNSNYMPPVRLDVYIQPRASTTELAGMHDGVIKIRIAAPAIENAANRALIDFIAQHLGIAKRSVRIVSGGASRRKVLEIDGVTADMIAVALGPKA